MIHNWVPKGYTVLEIAVPDEVAKDIGPGNAVVWKWANPGDKWLCCNRNEVCTRVVGSHWFINVIVPTTPPAPQYRDPTQADVGKMVEVRCSNKDEWVTRELLSVIVDSEIERRFICRILETNVGAFWDFARIKIE